MNQELKPCPFCGSHDITIGDSVCCYHCGATMTPKPTETMAEAWNRRASSAAEREGFNEGVEAAALFCDNFCTPLLSEEEEERLVLEHTKNLSVFIRALKD